MSASNIINNVGLKKVCVLLPDYTTSDIDYQHYDPPRNLSNFLPGVEVEHVFLNKLTTYKQLKDLSKKGFDIFVNLCEGYLDWSVPSIDVIYFLELLKLPFTGPSSLLYDPTKELMKYVAYTQGVNTPAYVLIERPEDVSSCNHLRYPLFVKPSKAGDSLGIDDHSLVNNYEALVEKVNEIFEEYGPILVEEFIDGREFTVMLVRNPDEHYGSVVFRPVEYVFPSGKKFKTYALKTSELHTDANRLVEDPELEDKLKKTATDIFNGFGGVGYARLDFRMNSKGELFFLEINFTCSVFYSDGYEGSADYILKMDGTGQEKFLKMIIHEGMERYRKGQKKYKMKGNSISGYGIYANCNLEAGEVVFKGEERSQRIATASYINKNWSVKELENFKKYAYPISNEVFLLWDENPDGWAPQNHCCDPNTHYIGLDVIALHPIKIGEELTLDYADFLDEHMDPFNCRCGSKSCRGLITGIIGNSVSSRIRNY
jgi:D-alanine-D-alanine ligase